MLLFIFVGFIIGFALSLRLVRNPRKALIWGGALGVVPLVLLLGPANAAVQGIGSPIYFAFFMFGPIMLVPFTASGAALGIAGASIVLWVGQVQPRWASWGIGVLIVGFAALVTLLPVAEREMEKRHLAQIRDTRIAAIARADFTGSLAGHQVGFPASPRLHVWDDCAPGVEGGSFGCSTDLTSSVSTFSKPSDVLLHERRDPIRFQSISISPVEHVCRPGNDFCLTQEKIDHWCSEIRPDQALDIWCRDIPAIRFRLITNAKPGPSDRDEPELAAQYANTALGPGWVTCFYSPNSAETDRQGASCTLFFDLDDGVTASLFLRRTQIIADDPKVRATLSLIPEYWGSLTKEH
ncbi:MAG: hypothetical protein OIF47_15175 [Marinibacterium sp.]|nr:hypothetical protein [Marinibacterium sp.]